MALEKNERDPIGQYVGMIHHSGKSPGLEVVLIPHHSGRDNERICGATLKVLRTIQGKKYWLSLAELRALNALDLVLRRFSTEVDTMCKNIWRFREGAPSWFKTTSGVAGNPDDVDIVTFGTTGR